MIVFCVIILGSQPWMTVLVGRTVWSRRKCLDKYGMTYNIKWTSIVSMDSVQFRHLWFSLVELLNILIMLDILCSYWHSWWWYLLSNWCDNDVHRAAGTKKMHKNPPQHCRICAHLTLLNITHYTSCDKLPWIRVRGHCSDLMLVTWSDKS